MKKIIFVLAVAALCGAAFANNISDPEVTITGWISTYYSEVGGNVFDLGDGKGFTVTANESANSAMGYWAYTDSSGWVFDENESITLTILESDTAAEDDVNVRIQLFGTDDSFYLTYVKPYRGVGEYVFSAEDALGSVNPIKNGTTPRFIYVYVGDSRNLPAGGKFTATFAKVDKPETVVPEPASAAYALIGLAPVFGLKRRIKK